MSVRFFDPYVRDAPFGDTKSISGMQLLSAPGECDILIYAGNNRLTWQSPCPEAPTGAVGAKGPKGAVGPAGDDVSVEHAIGTVLRPDVSISLFVSESASLDAGTVDGFAKTVGFVGGAGKVACLSGVFRYSATTYRKLQMSHGAAVTLVWMTNLNAWAISSLSSNVGLLYQ